MRNAISIAGFPLVGKSTQAAALARILPNIGMVDTGEILRNFDPGQNDFLKQLKTEIDRRMAEGELLESELVQNILGAELDRQYGDSSLSEIEILVFPGSPRKLAEADWLMNTMLPQIGFKLSAVYHLDVPIEELDRRRQLRKGRESEDTAQGFAKRVKKFNSETVPTIDRLDSLGLVVKIDGFRSIEEVTNDIASHLLATTVSL